MRCRRARILAGAVALAAFAQTARAETLEDAWQRALERDFTLAAAAERVAGADAALEAARAERRPTIAASASLSRWDTTPAFDFSGAGVPAELPLFGGQSWLMSEARVSVPVYTGGRIDAGIEAASARLATSRAANEALALDVKLDVARRYIDVLHAESAVDVATANVTSLAAHASDVEDMYRSGQVPRNDYLAATVALADARQQALQARSGLEIARAAYNRSIGRELGAPVALDASLPPTDPALGSRSLDALVALATERRHELAQLTAATASLQAQSSQAQAANRPQISVSGGYTYLENRVLTREDYWSVGLNVQWSLFDSGRSRNAAAALARQAAATSRERANLETLIELGVREAWLDVEETRERVGVTEGAVAQAEENLRVVRDRYRNGEGTNTEVLDAEALWRQSRSNYDSARYDAALAKFRLARAVGLL